VLTAAIILAVGFVLSLIVTERVRDIVDARRVRERGIGGTQDVALWGLLVALVLVIASLVGMILAVQELRRLRAPLPGAVVLIQL
jgi:hypothetical protein